MVSEGSPGRCCVMANLAAHLCGYVTYKINPSPVSSPMQYKMESFKSDLVTAYTRAGVKVNFYAGRNDQIFFGSFGLSTKEPYTIMLCPSSSLSLSVSVLSLSLYSPPSHMFRQKLQIWCTYVHMPLVYAHQIFRDSDIVFK